MEVYIISILEFRVENRDKLNRFYSCCLKLILLLHFDWCSEFTLLVLNALRSYFEVFGCLCLPGL